MDLGLTRQQAARRLGVWDEALRKWEAGRTRPGPKHLRAIKAFLGADPIKPTDSLGQRLRDWRATHRVSMTKAAGLCGLHEVTIARVERGLGRWISTKVRRAIEALLHRRPGGR